MNPADIRRFRSRHGLSQRSLAAFLGVTQTQVARWERGERGWSPYLGLALVTVERDLLPHPAPLEQAR